jgi:NADPH-dependent 2,4-dienoyl-CoA reductase/sulfur reductase-like enzyme
LSRVPFYISREVADWRNLAHRTQEDLEKEGIQLLLEHTAQKIHPEHKQITVIDPTGFIKILNYDKLLIPTGAVSYQPNISGLNHPGVFFLRWMPDCLAIDEYLNQLKTGTAKEPLEALIVGSGYIGMEMSEALVKRGVKVTVVEAADSVLSSLDPYFGAIVRDTLLQKGIMVLNQTTVESIEKKENRLLVSCSNQVEFLVDLVLVSAGSIPNTTLGKSIGIPTGVKGALQVNRRLETNLPDIYAAGDCVETWHRVLQRNVYLPLGTVAHKQGRIAGENMIGGNREFAGTLGTQSVKIFDKVVARTGLSEAEAISAGITPVSAELETWDHKVYFPPAEKLVLRVTAVQKTRRIIGSQIIGAYKTEVSKRIDILATAIYHEMKADEFSEYDISYTPPLSSPWDPVQLVVQKLERKNL